MTFFLIAGEASGDLHASQWMQSIRERDPEARFVGLGGDLMAAAGCQLYQHYREMAYMGFVAVLRNLHKVRRNFRIAQQALLRERPEQLVLIDYPSFTLRMAAFCRKHLPETRIVYYIPPKVWAWKTWRIHRIAKLTDEVQAIFPFEPPFYQKYGYSCRYVGNPTAQEVACWLKEHPGLSRTDTIAILPGSRPSEIAHCLPTMLAAAQQSIVNSQKSKVEGQKSKVEILIAGAPGVAPEFYEQYAGGVPVVFGDTYRLLATSKAAIVNSGTATLEAALLGCPQVAVYRLACARLLGFLRPMFAHRIFRLRYFTLPNIILGREAIPELMAEDFTPALVTQTFSRLLTDEAFRNAQLQSYSEIKQQLYK